MVLMMEPRKGKREGDAGLFFREVQSENFDLLHMHSFNFSSFILFKYANFG